VSKAGLLLRGMRWRAGASLLTVITSAIAVGAAALGPLYLHTAGDSTIRSTVAAAPVEARGVTLSSPPGQSGRLGQILAAERVVERTGASHHWYGAPITTVLTGVGLLGPGASPLRSQLLSRSGICRVLSFRAGGCELGRGDVLISDRSARELRVSLGSVIHASVRGSPTGLYLRVTGVYAPPDPALAYWWGNGAGYFPFGETTGGQQPVPELDSLITSQATALAVPPQALPQLLGQLPLRVRAVGLGDEAELKRELAGVAAIAGGGVAVSSGLPALLSGADHQRQLMATIVLVAAIELVVLALWVLGGLLVRTSEGRRAEIRVARLRGFPVSTMLLATAAEPLILCALGVLLGVGAAWAAVVVARDRLLDPAATVSPDVWTFAALALTVLAILAAIGVGTARLLRGAARSEGSLTPGSQALRLTAVLDLLLLLLSVVALVALGTSGALSGRSDPIASAAPGLISLGVAVLAVHLVLFACRRGVSASAFSPHVGPFLALRQIARRPSVLRSARVLVVALGLACFATSAWSVARRNRASIAAFELGAPTVVTVTPQGTGLEQAVDRVDPRGRFAMAAVTLVTPSSQLLAVDARRLPAVASWPRGLSRRGVRAISRALRPPTSPEVRLPQAAVAVTASSTATPAAAARLSDLELGLWVANPQLGVSAVALGPLRNGTRTYRAALLAACPGGCRLAGIGVLPVPNRAAPSAGTLDLHVTSVATVAGSGRRSPVSADFSPGAWRATVGSVAVTSSRASGLSVVIPAAAVAAEATGSAAAPLASIADVPPTLPAAVTSEVRSLNGGPAMAAGIPTQGLDGATLSADPVATVPALPRVGTDAVMVDLDLLGRLQSGPPIVGASDQVWLGPAAPADALARLQRAGLRPDAVQRASATLRQAQRTAPALADDFLVVATLAALLAAAASTLGTLATNARQRMAELAALELAGVSRRSLAGALAVEAALLTLTAAFGIGAGILAAAMAVPALPELASAAPIPLQYGLPAGLLAAVSAAVLAAVLLASAAAAVFLINRTNPSLLRTAPDEHAV